MSIDSRNMGVTTLGTSPGSDIFAGATNSESIQITIASGEGVLTPGTLIQKNPDSGKFEVYDSTFDLNDGDGNPIFGSSIAGVLYEDIDATSKDVLTFLLINVELDKDELTADVPEIYLGYFPSAAMLIKENL